MHGIITVVRQLPIFSIYPAVGKFMSNIKSILILGASLCFFPIQVTVAQEAFVLDEIVVTGRKREETLQDVPVSVSVISATLVEEAGLLTQRDLFELTPGLHYDQGDSRNTALPSIRGVQSNEQATNRTKVTAFIDGMPVLGTQGSIGFQNLAQIEVYRGPQSAAFGRSTFGGAINYITKDPGADLEGSIGFDVNDYGRRILNGTYSGPISESVGFLVDASIEDTDAYDDYVATDGTEFGTRSGNSVLGKLVFFPSENTEVEFALSHVETEDGPVARYFISEEARTACFDGTETTGMGDGVYGSGSLDCDWSQGGQIAAQYDREAFLIENGETDGDILALAAGQSIPDSDIGSFSERDRASVNFSYFTDNDSTLQVLAFHSDEEYVSSTDDGFNADEAINIIDEGTDPATYTVAVSGMDVTQLAIRSDPTDITESYLEARWVSPEDEKLRYVVGASYYDYDFYSEIYQGGYGAVLAGQTDVDLYDSLAVLPAGTSISDPRQVFSEQATNMGLFFNLTYDFTYNLTATLEGRYQSDDVSGTNEETGISDSIKTSAFLPRLSVNYAATDNVSLYGQVSKGNNPAGVNTELLDGDAANSELFLYEEETLINYEIGAKGTAANDRFKYSVALFQMDWSDQAQSVNLETTGGGGTDARAILNEGDLDITGVEFESDYLIGGNWSLRSTLTLLDATYSDYCSSEVFGNGLGVIAGLDEELSTDSGRVYDCYDVSGLDIVQQPSLTASLSPTFGMDIGNRGMFLDVRADLIHEGSEYLDAANVAELSAVTTMNFSVNLGGDNWNAALYVNNVTDEDRPVHVESADDRSIATLDPDPVSNFLITPRDPRTVGLRASYQF